MGLAEIGAKPGGIGEVIESSLEITARALSRSEPVVRLPGIGIRFERVGPEVVFVGKDVGIPQRRNGQAGEEHRGRGEGRKLDGRPRRSEPHCRRSAQRHDDADDRHIVEVVGHPGDPHVGNGDEAEDREDHQEEEAEAEDRMAGQRRCGGGAPTRPQPATGRDEDRPGEELRELRRIDLPLRIDRQEPERKDRFDEVEHDRHPRRGRPRQEADDGEQVGHWHLLLADCPAMLVVDRDQPENEGDEEERCRRDDVALRNSSPLPPSMEEEHHGEHHHRCLGEHREREKNDRQDPIAAPRATGSFGAIAPHRVVMPDEEDSREEEEGERDRVLDLRHPGHALDAHRMDREQEPGQPSPRDSHHHQQPPQQERSGGMKEDRDDMVAGGVQTEERPLGPERRVGEGEVIGPRRADPKVIEPFERRRLDDGIGGEDRVVVPQPIAVVGRSIDPQDRQEDHSSAEQQIADPGDTALPLNIVLGRDGADARRGHGRLPDLRFLHGCRCR